MIASGKRGVLFEIEAEGHGEPLYVTSLMSSCGNIADGDGVSLRFGDRGGFAIALADLAELVQVAIAEREAWARLHRMVEGSRQHA